MEADFLSGEIMDWKGWASFNIFINSVPYFLSLLFIPFPSPLLFPATFYAFHSFLLFPTRIKFHPFLLPSFLNCISPHKLEYHWHMTWTSFVFSSQYFSITHSLPFKHSESAHFKSRFRAETFRTGDPGRVTCEAFGDRPIKIDWMKDNQLLVFDPGRYLLYPPRPSSTFFFSQLIHYFSPGSSMGRIIMTSWPLEVAYSSIFFAVVCHSLISSQFPDPTTKFRLEMRSPKLIPFIIFSLHTKSVFKIQGYTSKIRLWMKGPFQSWISNQLKRRIMLFIRAELQMHMDLMRHRFKSSFKVCCNKAIRHSI